jgi:hypothetical protein
MTNLTTSDGIVDRHARIAVGLPIQPADHFGARIHLLTFAPSLPSAFMGRVRELRGLVGVR